MIFLVHHADAVGPEVDPQRPLSPAGQAHAARLAAETAAAGVKPAVIWHSGKLRARQTADAFLRACNPFAELSAIRGLQPTDPPEWIRDLVTGEQRDVMLVGHLPNVARVRALLVSGGDQTPPEEFPQHGIVALQATHEDSDRWRELWRKF